MSYQPFLIAEHAGLFKGLTPWKALVNAGLIFKNTYIKHDGTLKKRRGYKPYLDTEAGLPITGVFSHVTLEGDDLTLVTDTEKLYKWDAGDLLEVVTGSPPAMTGTSSDLVVSESLAGVTYYTNGVTGDILRYYDGTVAGEVTQTTLTTPTAIDITGAKFIKVFKERVLLFNLSEGGERIPQRIRWSPLGSGGLWFPDFSAPPPPVTEREWDPLAYLDLPTNEIIYGVDYSTNHIVIFTANNTWKLEALGTSPDTPFRVQKVTSGIGARGYYSTVSYHDNVFAFDKEGIIIYNGRYSQRLDAKIPDFFVSFNTELIGIINGVASEETRQIVWLYPSVGATENDSALTYNYEKNTWATWEIGGIHRLGLSTAQDFEAYKDLVGTFKEWDEPFNTASNDIGFPILLGGGVAGEVFKMNTEATDDGVPIDIDVFSGQYNPFIKEGYRARLGYIDFILKTTEPLDIGFYIDFEDSAYATGILDPGQEINRVYSGAVGDFHRVRITGSVSSSVEIEGMILYFRKAGRIK